MKASAAEASCSSLSLYAFKPRFIQSECRISDLVVNTFPDNFLSVVRRCARHLCMYKYVRVPAVHKSFHFISFHFIPGHFVDGERRYASLWGETLGARL